MFIVSLTKKLHNFQKDWKCIIYLFDLFWEESGLTFKALYLEILSFYELFHVLYKATRNISSAEELTSSDHMMMVLKVKSEQFIYLISKLKTLGDHEKNRINSKLIP